MIFLAGKNKEDPYNNEGTRVFAKLYIDYSGAQGQVTLQSVVGSG